MDRCVSCVGGAVGRGFPGGRRRGWRLAVGLWLVIGAVVPAWAAGVRVETETGVDPSSIVATNRAVETLLAFFAKTYDLTLDHEVFVKLTADKNDYVEALVHEARNSPVVAAKQAEVSTGVSQNNTIVERLGRRHDPAEVTFLICHELTHQFQDQARGRRYPPATWMNEGVADCLAGLMVERLGLGRLATLDRRWRRAVAAASDRPRLAQLRRHVDWSAARDRYGAGLVYRLGDVAVLELIDRKGVGSLFDYFKFLAEMPHERAFQEAFGLDADAFEVQVESSL